MSRKLISFLMIALVMFATTAVVIPQATAQTTGGTGGGLIVPISGAINGTINGLTGAASYVGTYTINSFQVVNGQLQSVGTATVNILDAAGNILGTVTNANVVGAVTNGSGTSCTILTVDVGAVHLNLLGLVVDLAPIHLNITAQQGAGNLLGNLLCSVANLLNNNGPVQGIAGLLNNILRNL